MIISLLISKQALGVKLDLTTHCGVLYAPSTVTISSSLL